MKSSSTYLEKKKHAEGRERERRQKWRMRPPGIECIELQKVKLHPEPVPCSHFTFGPACQSSAGGPLFLPLRLQPCLLRTCFIYYADKLNNSLFKLYLFAALLLQDMSNNNVRLGVELNVSTQPLIHLFTAFEYAFPRLLASSSELWRRAFYPGVQKYLGGWWFCCLNPLSFIIWTSFKGLSFNMAYSAGTLGLNSVTAECASWTSSTS